MITTFGFFTPTVAIILLILALIIFGPGKLPELGSGLGKGIKEFRSAANTDVVVSNSKRNQDDV